MPAPLQSQGLKLHESLRELEAAARKDSNDAAAQYNLALGYWSKKRWDEAERAMRAAVTIEPMFAQAWLALGALPYARRPSLFRDAKRGAIPKEWQPKLLEAGRYTRRAFLVDPLVDLKIIGTIDPPPDYATQVILVLTNPFAAFLEGDYGQAFRILNQWITAPRRKTHTPVPRDSVPPWILVFHGLAAAHIDLNDVAISDFQVLLDRDTALANASVVWTSLQTNDYRYLLALMHQRQRQWPEAIQMYRAALENDLGLYMAHVQMSTIYETRQLYDSGVVESRAAVLTSPEDPSLMLHHGVLLTEAGYLSAAEDTLRRAMNANPRDSRIPYYLGITEQAMRETAEARAAFERFLALAPSRYDKYIQDAHARLETLQ